MSTDNEMSREKNQILSVINNLGVIDECIGKYNWDLKSQKYGIWGFFNPSSFLGIFSQVLLKYLLFLSEIVITEVKHHLYAVAGHFERLILIQFNW